MLLLIRDCRFCIFAWLHVHVRAAVGPVFHAQSCHEDLPGISCLYSGEPSLRHCACCRMQSLMDGACQSAEGVKQGPAARWLAWHGRRRYSYALSAFMTARIMGWCTCVGCWCCFTLQAQACDITTSHAQQPSSTAHCSPKPHSCYALEFALNPNGDNTPRAQALPL